MMVLWSVCCACVYVIKKGANMISMSVFKCVLCMSLSMCMCVSVYVFK